MNLKRCEKGHFYDADRYMLCPRCQMEEEDLPVAEGRHEEDRTESDSASFQYPVGWLVCIEGFNRGKIYQLKSGKNIIGSADTMDICLKETAEGIHICRGIINYDVEKRTFLVSAGNSRELAYVNSQAVLVSVGLKNRDRIKIGGETLMFISLCGEDFSWETN